MATQWWQQKPTKRYHTVADGVTLSTGVIDVEKGDIYSVSPGSPISVPIPSRVAWEDHEHVVLQTTQGIFNFLHVNPELPVGTDIPSNSPFASASPIGSPGYPGSYYDANSHMTYQESGSILEFGKYDTVQRAAQRENFVNGVDQPWDFTGISDPLSFVQNWQAGKTPQTPVPNTSLMSFSPKILLFLLVGVVLFLMWKKNHR